MTSAKLLLGGAGATALAVRVARSLHTRWSSLPPGDRERIAPLAEATRASALELRGATDRAAAGAELKAASESLAGALVESAENDPELDEAEVSQLRADLRRELDRLSAADIVVRCSPDQRSGSAPPQ